MFLHAFSVSFLHPLTGEKLSLEAPLPKELDAFVRGLEKA